MVVLGGNKHKVHKKKKKNNNNKKEWKQQEHTDKEQKNAWLYQGKGLLVDDMLF